MKQLAGAATMLLALTIIFALGYKCGGAAHGSKTDVDTVTRVDTVTLTEVVCRDSAVVRYVTRVVAIDTNAQKDTTQGSSTPLALTDDSDSAAVVLPITQKRYEGDDYTAWVSGYEPALDSIRVLRRTETITLRDKPPDKRWAIGVQVGAGITAHGRVEPYIGVGVSYAIFRF